jgi:thymidylate kinase
MLRDCVVLAIEGTHASGKTTLTHALAAYYRERGIHVATVEEPARHSPFIEEIVVHGKGAFDLEPRSTCSPPSCRRSCAPPASTR